MLVYGKRIYGRVDEVPGVGYVATQFEHLYGFPLVPLGAYLVLWENGGQFRGLRIPLSAKSILVAWVRAVVVTLGVFPQLVGAVAVLWFALDGTNDPVAACRPTLLGTLLRLLLAGLAALPGLGGLWLTYRVRSWRWANPERTRALAAHLGLARDNGEQPAPQAAGHLEPPADYHCPAVVLDSDRKSSP